MTRSCPVVATRCSPTCRPHAAAARHQENGHRRASKTAAESSRSRHAFFERRHANMRSAMSEVTKPVVVLFDIDETLVHTGGAGARSWKAAFEKLYGIPADIGEH